MVGTCWGSYLVFHTSVDPLVKAGASVHPYHAEVMAHFNESESQVYYDVENNGAAEYLGPTFAEGDTVRPGGLADSILTLVIRVIIFLIQKFQFVNCA